MMQVWVVRLMLGLTVCMSLGACMRAGSRADVRFDDGPRADSVTTALWRMDETGGTRVPEASPFRLEGIAGPETITDFGRFNGARRFRQSLDSFVIVPDNPLFNFRGSFTIEAWIQLDDYGWYEATPIVAKWTPVANEQSWFFGIVGYKRRPPASPRFSPGYLNQEVAAGRPGTVMFAFQPEDAGLPRAFFSTRQVEIDRWTHVAATYDGEIVRIYVNGQVEGQYATTGAVRASTAPVMIGNFFDPRWLGTFGGDLRIEQPLDGTPYYAFTGVIDELRISSAARRDFPQQ
jgi:hypothetical protein